MSAFHRPVFGRIPKAPDEDCLPFKAMYSLAYSDLQARILTEPEFAHPSWNNVLAAINRSGLQPTLLITTLLSHVNHGPWKSGKTMMVKQEICADWVENMSSSEWESLREAIAFDRNVGLDSDEIPSCPRDLLQEPTIASRGIFVPGLMSYDGGYSICH